MNAHQLRQMFSYAPQYIGSLMRLLTQPSIFLVSEFSGEKSRKQAIKFLCASFVVAVARILFGEFTSLSEMESKLRWDSVITLLFVVGLIALAIYMLLHMFRSTLSHDQCLVCSIYYISAAFIFAATAYSICMPLLNKAGETVKHLAPEQLTATKFFLIQGPLLFMFAAIFALLLAWPLYLLWGIGKAGNLGMARNFGFTSGMTVISMITVWVAMSS